jgi:hypothetical protein
MFLPPYYKMPIIVREVMNFFSVFLKTACCDPGRPQHSNRYQL